MYPDRDDRWGVAWALSTAFLLDTIGVSPDTDGDGMRDDWEIANGTDYLAPDAHLDPDNDDLTNLEEYNSGTDPLANDWLGPDRIASDNFMVDTGGLELGYFYDSDGDGMPDWWENEHGLLADTPDAHGNPDGDGLDNLEKYNSGSDPNKFDLLIIQSAEGNIFILDTGGRFMDTDGDGIPDWWERKFGGDTDSMDADADSDDDGMSDGEEYIANTDPMDDRSILRVSKFEASNVPGTDGWVITWQSQPDRTYKIYSTTDLSAAWDATPVYQVDGDGTQKSYTNSLSSVKPRFFRIEVELLE